MTQYLTEQNITLIVSALVAFCSLLSAVLQLAGKTTASKFVGGLPTAIDLGGILRWLARDKVKLPKVDAPGAVLLLAMSTLLMPLCSGCAGTLDESRGIANVSSVAGVTVTANARQNSLCSRYSNVEYATRIAGGVLAVAAGAAGFSAWPVKSEKWEHRLEVATAVSGTASVGSYWVANQQASLYVEKGCAK